MSPKESTPRISIQKQIKWSPANKRTKLNRSDEDITQIVTTAVQKVHVDR